MTSEPLIMVIDRSRACGLDLKQLIEFMDAPRVRVADPDTWRARLGDDRLAAVFLGGELDSDQKDRVIREIGELDPNTPIVRLAAHGDGPSVAGRGG
jgi:hypothetical protein